MLAHDAVQMREALEVQDLLWRGLAAHAGVPLVVALDKADNTTAAVAEERLLEVGGVVGDELRLLAGAGNRLDSAHDHVGATLGNLESGVDLVGVVVGANVVQSRLVLWLEILAAGLREIGSWYWNFKKGKDGGDRLDGGDVEVFPAAQVADVPPEVVVDASWCVCHTADQRGRGIGRGEVLDKRRSRSDRLEGVEADICKGRVLYSWRGLKLWDNEVLSASGSEAGDLLYRGVGQRKRGDEAKVRLGRTRSSHVAGEVAVGREAISADDVLIDASGRLRPSMTASVC